MNFLLRKYYNYLNNIDMVLLRTSYICTGTSSNTILDCSLAVSTQDSPAVEPRSNPGSGKILMSENLRLYTTSPLSSCHVLIDKVLSSD